MIIYDYNDFIIITIIRAFESYTLRPYTQYNQYIYLGITHTCDFYVK